MEVIIKESQVTNKIYDKFIDMLVDNTEVYDATKFKYRDYEYVAFIKYPYYDNPYNLLFNDEESYNFTTPGRYNLKNWFLFIGIDMDELPHLCEKLWLVYLDKLGIKIKSFIIEYLNK